jgi:hypothetical protein
VELSLNAKCEGDTTMDIYARDLVKSGHGIIGSPVIAGSPTPQISPIFIIFRPRRERGVNM